MKTKIALIVVLLLLPSAAFAQNIGKCGWGSKLMDGQSGIVPQVLAATTNGTSGNQTFAITTGTSGCTQNGVVHSSWKTAMFIDGNRTKLARDMSVGEGEALESLASLMGVDAAHKASFFAATKSNFARIFPTDKVSTDEVMASLKGVVSESPELAGYAKVL